MLKQITSNTALNSISRLLLIVMTILAVGLVSGCGSSDKAEKHVELIFSHSPARWQEGAESMVKTLQADGYVANLQVFDSNDKQRQAMQAAIDAKPACIVLAGGNDEIIADELKKAKEADIPIIAYDSMVKNTDAISYFVTFDNEGVGESMGRYIEEKFNLQSGAGPFTIEFLSGSEHDSNARLMHDGAYKILKPYIDKGQLVNISGKASFEETAVKDWNPDNAKSMLQAIVAKNYNGRNLDIVVAASDGIAYGAIEALSAYNGSWPFITGQDADKKALEYVRNGRMGVTIQKDSATLNYKCLRMIKAVVEGSKPDINDVKTYNNGVITIPAYLCIPRIIDKENIDSIK